VRRNQLIFCLRQHVFWVVRVLCGVSSVDVLPRLDLWANDGAVEHQAILWNDAAGRGGMTVLGLRVGCPWDEDSQSCVSMCCQEVVSTSARSRSLPLPLPLSLTVQYIHEPA
jgi:hypothetical protein